MGFRPPAYAGPAQAAINDVAILALQPPLSPPTPLPPRRAGKGGPTTLCGRVLEVDEFNVNRQLSKRPLTAGCGRVFKGVAFTMSGQPSK